MFMAGFETKTLSFFWSQLTIKSFHLCL